MAIINYIIHLNRRIIVPGNDSIDGQKIETTFVPLARKGVDLIIEATLLCALAGLWTALRLWSRHLIGVRISLEDWIHLAALVFFYGQAASAFVAVFAGGAGHHVSELQEWHISRFSKAIFMTEVLYSLSIGLVKISITIMLMRIFITRKVKIAGICILVYSAIWMLHPLFTGLLVCKPIRMNWDPNTPGGSCGNQYIGFGIVAGLDILNELCLLVLPIPSVLKLHLNLRYKVALAGIFCTGILTLVVAIVRIPLLLQTNFSDLTYDTGSQMIALAEPAVAIVTSCSPVLRPLFDRAFVRFFTRERISGIQRLGKAAELSGGNSAGAKPHKYARFDDSDELLELRSMEPYCTTQGTHCSASRRLSDEGPGSEMPDYRGNSNIVVVRETVISRDI
ncbi:hypothetical protein F4781DRAFT_408663 [Annulohypoxylon bovei var. microspora]|nr:hypothetical protein F4781DRAFT_408663 [Annulohypoxylon bovei var. microspora]